MINQTDLPYQELLGNYNSADALRRPGTDLPYQELLGNYNSDVHFDVNKSDLPYQELLGNYNTGSSFVVRIPDLPYQELLGNYNSKSSAARMSSVLPYQELRRDYNNGLTDISLLRSFFDDLKFRFHTTVQFPAIIVTEAAGRSLFVGFDFKALYTLYCAYINHNAGNARLFYSHMCKPIYHIQHALF